MLTVYALYTKHGYNNGHITVEQFGPAEDNHPKLLSQTFNCKVYKTVKKNIDAVSDTQKLDRVGSVDYRPPTN